MVSKGVLMGKKKQQLVIKDNALINAAYRLDLTEQRLVLMSTVRARETGIGITADQPLIVYADDYAEQFKVTRQAAYMALKQAINSLFERQFTYQRRTHKGLANVKSRWVSRVEYVKNAASVSITFAPDVVPLITGLEKEFTRYDLEQVSGLTSTYAVRLYELVISWRSTGKTPEIPLEQIRERLGLIDGEYSDIYNFKRRVLDLSIRQINEYTDIKADYKQHKSGRKISGFSFSFAFKNPSRDNNTVDMFAGKTDEERRPKRKKITRQEAEKMALPGESWSDLLNRISNSFFITYLS